MKTTVTLTLDADLLREVRSVAADEGRSISALLIDHLQAIVRERKAFDKARRRALRRLRVGLDLQWTPSRLETPFTNDSSRQKGHESTMASRNVEWTEPVTRGTGNVFADLGFPDAAERQARLRLAYALNQILEARKLLPAAAAEALGVTQPSFSALRHYRLAGFSLERLMNLLTAVDFDVEIVIRKKPRSRKAARIRVRQYPRPLPSPAMPHRSTLR